MVGYNVLVNYRVLGGGHDATSYWLWYQNDYEPSKDDYAVVVQVPGGFPPSMAWAPRQLPKPWVQPSGGVTIVGGTLSSNDVSFVRQGVAPVPRAAFVALAGATSSISAAVRTLSAPELTVPIQAFAEGSLATRISYVLRAGRSAAGVGVSFSQIPLFGPVHPVEGGAIVCGASSATSRAYVLFGFSPSVQAFAIYEDGRKVVASHPATDPLVPSTKVFALTMPQTVHNITTTVPGGVRNTQSLGGCLND